MCLQSYSVRWCYIIIHLSKYIYKKKVFLYMLKLQELFLSCCNPWFQGWVIQIKTALPLQRKCHTLFKQRGTTFLTPEAHSFMWVNSLEMEMKIFQNRKVQLTSEAHICAWLDGSVWKIIVQDRNSNCKNLLVHHNDH